jgi:hypothetical protein
MLVKNLKKIGIIAVASIALFTACQKEVSFEDPLGGVDSGPVIGNNCVVSKIIDFDTVSNTGLAALNYFFSTGSGRVNSLTEFDSISSNLILNANYSYNADTIRLDPDQYFVVEPSGRVKKFAGLTNPYDPLSDLADFEYFYDASGKLIRRTVSDPLFPGLTIIESTYAYAGNNLASIDVKIPLLNVTYQRVNYEYYFDRVPRNYINILPDCDELAPYVAALNMGQKSLNPVKKISLIEFDPLTGTQVDSLGAEFKNYKYSRDGYVLSVDMDGDDMRALPFNVSRNKFEYFCR